MSNLKEYEEATQTAVKFFEEYGKYFTNDYGTITVEDYVLHFNERLKSKAHMFTASYPFHPNIIEKYKDNIVCSFQPGDKKRGFLIVLFQFRKDLHLFMEFKTNWKHKQAEVNGWGTFILYKGIIDALEWVKDNGELVNDTIFEEHEVGFSGLSIESLN